MTRSERFKKKYRILFSLCVSHLKFDFLRLHAKAQETFKPGFHIVARVAPVATKSLVATEATGAIMETGFARDWGNSGDYMETRLKDLSAG